MKRRRRRQHEFVIPPRTIKDGEIKIKPSPIKEDINESAKSDVSMKADDESD